MIGSRSDGISRKKKNMRSVPVDTSKLGQPKFIAAELRKDQEGKTRMYGDLPDYQLQVLVKPLDQPAEVLRVNHASAEVPKFAPLGDIVLGGLTALPWAREGRDGISFRCETVSGQKQ
jgi:hypothetical protein